MCHIKTKLENNFFYFFFQEFLKTLNENPGHTTADILERLSDKYSEKSKDDIFSRMKIFYNAAKYSGQILLRHKTIAEFPKSRNPKTFKVVRD